MQDAEIACVLMGDGSLLTECGNLLLNRGYKIVGVVTANEEVLKWAEARALAHYNSDELDGLSSLTFDWFFSIANLKVVPESVWRAARIGAANFHDGPLPRHAGLNAPAWAILEGDSEYGVSWHAMIERVDQGDIYVQNFFEVGEDETSFTLNMKCFEAGLASFGMLVESISAGTSKSTPQDLARRNYHPRHARPRAAATLNLSASNKEISQLARAMDFGAGYTNPLCLIKVHTETCTYNILSHELSSRSVSEAPGTVIEVDGASALIATKDGTLRINGLTTASGAAVLINSFLRSGDILPQLSALDVEIIEKATREIAPHETFFRSRLQNFSDLGLCGIGAGQEGASPQWQMLKLQLPPGLNGHRAVAGLIAGLARLAGQTRVDAFFCDDDLQARADRIPGYISNVVPLSVESSEKSTAETFSDTVRSELDNLHRRVGYAADLVNRTPRLGVVRSNVAIKLLADPDAAQPVFGSAITFVIPTTEKGARFIYDSNRLGSFDAEALVRRLEFLLTCFVASPDSPLKDLPLISREETLQLVYSRNATQKEHDRSALVHTLIAQQADISPDTVAIICGHESLTYGELDTRANRVANHLVSLGVGQDSLVGLNLKRSCDLVVGALAILKAGGAYVPLDPSYPADRIEYMIKDSSLNILLVEASALATTSIPGVRTVSIPQALAAVSSANRTGPRSTANNLAYVIYTSGSTGRPKGVMVEHRNVVNFFVGMDDRIARPTTIQPVWLAVTSLSFDISVLELFWTLARGFKVVIMPDEHYQPIPTSPAAHAKNMDFGLFYWGDDDSTGPGKYQLLLDGARFADQHGFNAVWTPERHFHAFGGPYPNPSVTGAAVAAVTKSISVRAGSCVLPLHHPARVAEEWAVIDNISNGRAAVAFATGWMPEDFLLRPENAPPANKASMFRDIEVVRKLWRGEKVAFEGAGGQSIEITTLPRPVQAELPIWITTAGNPETFRDAARHGTNVLTHLLGQSTNEVAEKVSAYRDELQRHGRDPSQFKVTLMLHTLIGRDRDVVREQVREPMKRYLKSAAALIKQYAWAFPAFKRPKGIERPIDLDMRTLDVEELDAVLEFAFQRYFDDSGLFGTVEDAVSRVNQLKSIGIDEIACLIDFGVPSQTAYEALGPLAEMVAKVKSRPTKNETTVAHNDTELNRAGALIRRHGVTHLQCTPAMATMLLGSDDDRIALADLKYMFIGGEALQGPLLKQLRKVTAASIENMYGPTETTIWSSTGPAIDTDGNVPLGTPIANTQLYVLDGKLQPVPPGLPGELLIGGEGVVRGYLNRPELTAERFIDNPFVAGGRMYRTGDLVRIGADGALHFIGRNDHQVKVRGHRIELGEIENCIGLHSGVAQVVVIVREDAPGDLRIVAYIRFNGRPVSDENLRTHTRQTLPEFMVPAHFVQLEQFPLTPNLKVDRKMLPKPTSFAVAAPDVYEAPASDLEKQIAEVFKRILGLDRIGLKDNFFDLGGHSLLAIQAHRALKAQVAQKMSVTDLYRFPTIFGLAGHLRDGDGANKNLDKIAARAAERRATFSARRTPVPRPAQ